MPQANSTHLDAALHLAERVGMRLAVLARDRRGRSRRRCFSQQLLELEHTRARFIGGVLAQARQRRLRRGDRRRRARPRVDSGSSRDLLAGRRIEDRLRARGVSTGWPTSVADDGMHRVSFECRFSSLSCTNAASVCQASSARSASVSKIWSICVFEMISGGDSAMMSPVVRTEGPSSKAFDERGRRRAWSAAPAIGSSSMAPIRPMIADVDDVRQALERMHALFPIGRELGAARQQALFLVGVERAEARPRRPPDCPNRCSRGRTRSCARGRVMKASWMCDLTNTAPIGMVPLVTPLAVVMMSGVTPK